ncbi:hypothetical protein FN846DRAFT_950197 [Sphaerosporella brunnea]|uniref:DNA mismatch repair protein S5 domain-containing protein n=1 Tax=Sphaerosporella brunnea TaxID=1250544 RepID=A0A5J5EW36_9PEZI|nr:hypothetical protein FN846DRAFT_950197 [Sphaerosporella brunnea]
MATIHALPTSTIHALGSGQVLTDPVSLVKELIENSLDANATQVTIEVSANLLDSIQVKDNGYGIAPTDRAVACRRHFTSKITIFDDIATVATLGFRGEALASAADLSQALSLTTRIEGEAVAEVYEIARDGEVKERRNIGAPVGTTIKVVGFLKRLPVRRESVNRNRAALGQRLRELVSKYYLSRPNCRFSLKILAKGTSKEVALVYAPSKTIPEAVQKVMGKDAASACQWVTKEKNGITVEAMLAKKDCNLDLLDKPHLIQYVYVDSRPVSCMRGTLASVRKLYKTHIKAIAGGRAPSNPALYLHIRCPKGIYDSNIEPAKDDVLFDYSRSQDVEAAVEELFTETYGELRDVSSGLKRKEKDKDKDSSEAAGFDILLARRRVVNDIENSLSTPPPPLEEEPDDIGLPPSPAPDAIQGSMDQSATETEPEQTRKDPTLYNPWTTAKLNAPITPRRHNRNSDATLSSPVRDLSSPAGPTFNKTPVRSSPHDPSAFSAAFTPVNLPRSRPDAGNSSSPVSSPARPQRHGYGIPPFPSPRSAERRSHQRHQPEEPTLLTDPENAGAMDRFVVRTPREPAQNQRPIPRRGFGGEDGHEEPSPGQAEAGSSPSEPSQSRPSHRRFRESADDSVPPTPRPRDPRPRGDFVTASKVYEQVGSQQADGDSGRPAPPAPKRRRLIDSEDEAEPSLPRQRPNPNKNRYLSATAALNTTMDVYGDVPPPEDSRRRGIPPPLPPHLLERAGREGPSNPSASESMHIEPPLPISPSPTEDQPPRHSTTRRRTTRTLPAPPLLPFDEEWQTYRLNSRLSSSVGVIKGLFSHRVEVGYRMEGHGGVLAELKKEEMGEIVKRWIERFTGISEENVKGWDLEPGTQTVDRFGEVEVGVGTLRPVPEE